MSSADAEIETTVWISSTEALISEQILDGLM
jgi:hypothetical protein